MRGAQATATSMLTCRTLQSRVNANNATILTSSSKAAHTALARKKHAVSVTPHMRSNMGKKVSMAKASITKSNKFVSTNAYETRFQK